MIVQFLVAFDVQIRASVELLLDPSCFAAATTNTHTAPIPGIIARQPTHDSDSKHELSIFFDRIPKFE